MIRGRVSVVVPIYNVEQYLDRCLTSIVNQTYEDLEIILVDDESPDRCPQMCEEWARRDARIRVIHKKNAGLGMARNTGIENAGGKYIIFVDSDDYIEENTVEECVRAAEAEQAQIVCYGNDKVLLNGKVVGERRPAAPKSVYSGEEVAAVLLPMMFGADLKTGQDWQLSLSGCFSLFSMEMIRNNNWRFVSEREIISEDFYSVLQLYAYAGKVVILDRIFYHYTTNPKSLSQTYRKDPYEKARYFYTKIQQLAQELNLSEVLDDGLCSTFLGITISCMKQIVTSGESVKQKRINLNQILRDEMLHEALITHDFSGENLKKKALYWACRHRLVSVAYGIIWLRELRD